MLRRFGRAKAQVRMSCPSTGGVETLESRRLLSAAACGADQSAPAPASLPPIAVQPDVQPHAGAAPVHADFGVAPPGATPDFLGGPGGYTPAEIRHAYGFDQVTYAGRTMSGDGTGQTIAIVDAYNDPRITSDLQTFDAYFGLPAPPSFKIVSQTGGSISGVANDSGWATEISLDVEWAHAIAPRANILLVEADAGNLDSLLAGVDYARHAAGVSTVSMSWGTGEFYYENSYDNIFTTPAGHTGVTFVAASGDSGSWYGPQWPASSPDVLSVGGTTLQTRDAAGNWSSENAWGGSTGGDSAYEPEPAYQARAQYDGLRSSPDVAYNADPNTGFPVYDSYAYEGMSGWDVFGGTSAGAPQWAALVAIADQGRAVARNAPLDGAGQTLPAIYSLYRSDGTYLANFHDEVSGPSSGFVSPAPGYDGITGLGSPKALYVVWKLIGWSHGPTNPITGAPVQTSAVRRTGSPAYEVLRETPPGTSPAFTAFSPAAEAAGPVVTSGVMRSVPGLSGAAAFSRSIIKAAAIGSAEDPPADISGLASHQAVAGAGSLPKTADALTYAAYAIAKPGSGWLASDGGASVFADQGQSSDALLMSLIEGEAENAAAGRGAAVSTSGQAVAVAVTPATAGAADSRIAKVASMLMPVLPGAAALYHFPDFDPATLFADAMARFAKESASISPLVLHRRVSRAWAITGAVIAVDAGFVARWYIKRRHKREAAPPVDASL